MIRRPLIFISILILLSLASEAQTLEFLGTSEEFILENVKDYTSAESRGLEHEEFDVLVFEDKDRELSFYFAFYRGAKICNYIRKKAPVLQLKAEIEYIKSNFTNTKKNHWEDAAKTVEVEINEIGGQSSIVFKANRN